MQKIKSKLRFFVYYQTKLINWLRFYIIAALLNVTTQDSTVPISVTLALCQTLADQSHCMHCWRALASIHGSYPQRLAKLSWCLCVNGRMFYCYWSRALCSI